MYNLYRLVMIQISLSYDWLVDVLSHHPIIVPSAKALCCGRRGRGRQQLGQCRPVLQILESEFLHSSMVNICTIIMINNG